MLSASYSSLGSIKPKLGAKGKIRTYDLQVMSLASWPLLHSAIKNLVPMTGIAPARLTARASKTRMAAVTSHRHKINKLSFLIGSYRIVKADSPLNGVTSVLEQPIRLTHLKTEPVWTSNLNLIKLENWGIRRESNPNLLSHNEQYKTSLHHGHIIFVYQLFQPINRLRF